MSAAQVILEIIEGPSQGEVFVFDQYKIALFGRSERCGRYCIGKDPECSRVHMMVEASPPVCRIRDLGSRNNTYLNKRKVTAAQVGNGDEIRIGRTLLKVKIENPIPDLVFEEEDRFVPAGHEVPQEVEGSDGNTLPPEVTSDSVVCLRCGAKPQVQEATVSDQYVCDDCRTRMVEGGEEIPGCRMIRQLARGGMGVIWLAEDTLIGRNVAVKMMIPEIATNWRMVQMFLRETRISLNLHHPHIVQFIRAGQYDGKLFVVMEYVDGQDAESARRQSGGRLPLPDVLALATQVLDALDYAHSIDIVHRDIKPGNILLQGSSPDYDVKITDFGLSRNYRAAGMSGITTQGDARGSIPFMAPEQVANPQDCDQRTDVFGLGATLYNLLTGEFIYDFSLKQDPFVTIIESKIVPLQMRGVELPAALVEIINKALSKEPDKRFQSAKEMSAALAAVQR